MSTGNLSRASRLPPAADLSVDTLVQHLTASIKETSLHIIYRPRIFQMETKDQTENQNWSPAYNMPRNYAQEKER